MSEIRREIPIEDIEVLDNSRIRFDEKELSSLMEDIKNRGLLQKIRVFFDKKEQKYILMFGHRRLEACRRLGYKTISADCVEGEEFDFVRFITDNLAENIQRKELTPLEVSRVVDILESKGLTASEISVATGLPKKRVRDSKNQISKVPESFRKDIVYQNPNSKVRKGVGITVADAITNQSFGRNKEETEKMFAYAKANETTIAEIGLIKRLMSKGIKFEDAIEKLKKYEQVTANIVVNKEIKAQYKFRSIGDLIEGFIKGDIKPNKDLVLN